MNTKTKHLLWILALSSALVLPACGKNEVKSEKTGTTSLKSAASPLVPPPPIVSTPTITASVSPTQTMTVSVTGTPNAAIPPMTNSYTKKKTVTNHATVTHMAMAKKSVPMMAAPLPTVVPTMAPSASTPMATFTPVTAEAPKKSGSHWPLIIAIIALVAAVGFYFWTKKAPPHNDFPLPPMGGLSPVGGYTAMRDKVKAETKKQSFWNKKLF